MTSEREQSVATTVSYLEMRAPLGGDPVAPPSDDVDVSRLTRPGVAEYRELYRGVGESYVWTERLLMDDARLGIILADERVEVFVLREAGEQAGYVELDRRVEGEVEIAYFGLFPRFYRRGLGRYLLDWAIRRAWSYSVDRLWVHTCTLDHPRALPTYLAAGFSIYATREERVPLLQT